MPLGIAHSAFLAWDESDQAKALAWRRHEKARCDCGVARSDDREYVSYAVDCEHCRALGSERSLIPEADQGPWWKFGLLTAETAAAIEREGEERMRAEAREAGML